MDATFPGYVTKVSKPLKPFHCGNKTCKGVLGLTDGERLVMGEAAFDKTVTITHTRCGEATTWRPVGASSSNAGR